MSDGVIPMAAKVSSILSSRNSTQKMLQLRGRYVDHVITPPLNRQTVQCASSHLARWFDFELVSIRIRQTGLGVDVTNSVSHLVYTFECALMRIAFASVDRPLVQTRKE